MKKQKKRKNKLIWLILVIAIIVVIAVVNINKKPKNNSQVGNIEQNTQNEEKIEEKFVNILDDGTKLNISEKIKETKKIDDIEIQNIQLTYKNGVTNILADVKNNGSAKIESTKIEIEFIDEDQNQIYKMQGIIEKTEVGKTSKLNSSITADFANAYDIKITKSNKENNDRYFLDIYT